MHQDDHSTADAIAPRQTTLPGRPYVAPALQRFGSMRELTELSIGQLLFGWFLGRGNSGGTGGTSGGGGAPPAWGGPPNPEQPALPPRYS